MVRSVGIFDEEGRGGMAGATLEGAIGADEDGFRAGTGGLIAAADGETLEGSCSMFLFTGMSPAVLNDGSNSTVDFTRT